MADSIAQSQAALATVDFRGGVLAAADVSAIARVGKYLVIGADEAVGPQGRKNVIQVFKRDDDDNHYRHHEDILLFQGDEKEELDIEGIAAVENVIYVIGSHSRKRPRTKPENSYKKNRKTFREDKVQKEPSRGQLFRLSLNAKGKLVPGSKDRRSLTKLIKDDPVLAPFRKIPSKENGVDIEGIAADKDWLTIGFRGPVLREGYVPVMRLKFDDPEATYKLRYVNLGGRGIRDIVAVKDGFLILAGPVGNGPGTFQLYHWDGRDMIGGAGRSTEKIGRVSLLKDLALSAEAKAEGLALLDENGSEYDLIVVFDGVENLLALRYRVTRPA